MATATYKQISYLESLLRKNGDLVEAISKMDDKPFSRAKLDEDLRDVLRAAEISDVKVCSNAIDAYIDMNRSLSDFLKKSGGSPIAEKTVELEEGFYAETLTVDSEETIQVWKIQMSKTGNLYAKKLEEDGSWTYTPYGKKHVAKNATKLDLETARKFGKLYGRCAACGRTLTKEESIEYGMGPVCRNKF